MRLKDFFFERLGLDVASELAAHKHVPIHGTTIFYFLGGMALFLFAIQVVTGILLALYYKPSPDQAFESVQAIMTEIDFGWLFRSVHSWSANLLIGVLFLHVLTTYMMRGIPASARNHLDDGRVAAFWCFWLSDSAAICCPGTSCRFLPPGWARRLWERFPWWENISCFLARSGEDITGDTLARFYALHVVILPLTVLALIAMHLFLVQKHEMSIPPKVVKQYGDEKKVPSMPFIPHFLLRDMVGWYVALGILAALGRLVSLGTWAEGRPLWIGPAGNQARMVLPLHVSGLKTSARAYRGHPVAGRRNGRRAVLRFLRAGGVGRAFSGLWGRPPAPAAGF